MTIMMMMMMMLVVLVSFLTLGGLGVVALRLGPEERASQDDLPVAACRRMDITLCIPVQFPWFRTGRRVS